MSLSINQDKSLMSLDNFVVGNSEKSITKEEALEISMLVMDLIDDRVDLKEENSALNERIDEITEALTQTRETKDRYKGQLLALGVIPYESK
jgi:hypothetical protein